jgi:hypothetical protein
MLSLQSVLIYTVLDHCALLRGVRDVQPDEKLKKA